MPSGTPPAPAGVPYADPYHCPDCHALLVDAGEGAARCPRCGFDSSDPLAAELWRIDCEQARLATERRDLIERMRRDRAGATGRVVPSEHRRERPAAPRRKVSVQALLVGLGAFLLVVAGVVFAAVTWDRLGAAGQAGVLAVATGTAAGAALVAARRALTSTAEALSVVAAGFAVVDVHAARIALAPDGPWQPVWAVGLVVVAIGLVVLGHLGHVRAPSVVAAGVAQLPLVILATMADLGPAGAGAMVATAAVDHALVSALRRSPRRWLPQPVRPWLRILGAGAWVIGVIAALPWAIGADDTVSTAEQWWGAVVLAAAAGTAAVVAATGRPGRRYPVAAAAGATAVVLATVVASAAALGVSGVALLLVATAAPVVVLGALVATGGRWALGARAPAVAVTATTWSAATLLGWLVPVVSSLAAPFVVLADEGWWTRGAGVSTGALDPFADLDLDRWGSLTMAAVPMAAATALLAVLALARPSPAVRGWAVATATGVAAFLVVALAAVRWDVPVWTLVALDLAAAVALVLGSAWPGRTPRPWLVLGALPAAITAVGWSGVDEVLTCLTVCGLTALAGGAVALGITGGRRIWTAVATAVTGVGLAATGCVVALALGAGAAGAWLTAVAVASVVSLAAFVADHRLPWWSVPVDVTSATTALCTFGALAVAGGPDPFSVGLAVVAVVAAAHVLRPSRRVVAAVVAAVAALVLLWLRLWVGDVRAVEAYSLPLAALLLAAGTRQLRRDPEVGSWPTLGPGLVVAALPSAAVAVAATGAIRPLVLLGIAVAVTIAGAVVRLRAPLLVGLLTAVVMGVDQVFPAAAQLPRWLTIGTLGVVLLVVGATFERRRQQATQLYRRYRALR